MRGVGCGDIVAAALYVVLCGELSLKTIGSWPGHYWFSWCLQLWHRIQESVSFTLWGMSGYAVFCHLPRLWCTD